MPEIKPVSVVLNVALEHGEDVVAEVAGHEFHIIATVGKLRRLIARVLPVTQGLPQSRPRVRRRHWGCALHPSTLWHEMATAAPLEPTKRKAA